MIRRTLEARLEVSARPDPAARSHTLPENSGGGGGGGGGGGVLANEITTHERSSTRMHGKFANLLVA